ncbi:MAG: hypothetical protein K2O66_07095 [Bacteroidales bacterium]|nr:hypothetical protein [Bacteroidales bacterium]
MAAMPEVPSPQFLGGIADGHHASSMPNRPGPPFVGGIGDGHHTGVMPIVPLPNYLGGIGDGHFSVEMDKPKPWPYMGGIADGHISMQVQGLFYPLYTGGVSDGFAKRSIPCDTTKFKVYADSILCAGDTLFLSTDSIPMATYSWKGPDGWTSQERETFRADFTAKMAGVYTVTIDPGCAGADDLPMASAIVANMTPVSVYAVIDSVVPNMPVERMCYGDTAVFKVSGYGWGDSARFEWRVNGNPIENQDFDSIALLTGVDEGFNITVAVYSSEECVDERPYVTKPIRAAVDEKKTVNVTIATDIDQSLSDLRICNGYPVRISSSYVNEGDKPVFIWLLNNDTLLAGSQDYILIDSLHNGDSIELLLISDIKCVDCRPKHSNVIRFEVKDEPVINVIDDQDINLGESVDLWASGGSEEATYTWTPCSTLNTCTGTDVTATPRTSTRYLVKLTEPWRCEVSDTVWVNVFTDVRILNHAQTVTVCDSSEASFTVKASGAELVFDWQVDQGDGKWIDISSLPKPNPYSVVPNGEFSTILYVGKDAATDNNITPLNYGMNQYRYRCRVSGVTEKSGKRDTVYSNDPAYLYGDARLYINRLQHAYGTIYTVPELPVCEGTQVQFGLRTQNNLAAQATVNWLVDGKSKQSGKSTTFTTQVLNGMKVSALITTGYECPAFTPEPSDTLTVHAWLNPRVEAGADTIVEYNGVGTLRGQLLSTGVDSGQSTAMVYSWTPANWIDGRSDSLQALTVPVKSRYQFTLTATNVNGCVGQDTKVVSIKGGPLSVDANQNLVVCEGDTVNLPVYPYGGTGEYTYTWTATPKDTNTQINTGFVSKDTSFVRTVSPVGVTIYRVKVSDGVDSVFKTLTVTVNKRMLSQPVITGDTNLCANATKGFRLGIKTDAYTGSVKQYRWFVDGVQDSRFDGSSYYDVLPADGSRVYCEITVGYACPLQNPVNTPEVGIHIFEVPTLTSITPDTSVCPGMPVQLSVNGKAIDSISWTPKDDITTGANATSYRSTVIARPYQNRTYTVDLFTEKGCRETGKVTISVLPQTAATTQNPDIFACENGEARFPVKESGHNLVYDWQKYDEASQSWKSITDAGTKYGDLNTAQLVVYDIDRTENGDLYRLHLSGTCPPDSISHPMTLNVIDSVYFDMVLVDTAYCQNDEAKVKFVSNLTGLQKKIDIVVSGSTTRRYTTRDSVFTLKVQPGDRIQSFLTPQGIIAQCVTPNPMPSQIIDLGVKESPVLSYKAANPKACATSDGSITLTASRGYSPYTYYFNDTVGANVQTDLPAGMYTALVIDNN